VVAITELVHDANRLFRGNKTKKLGSIVCCTGEIMRQINLLGICGSLRAKSSNKGLLRFAQANLPPGLTLEIADLSQVPLYNADIAQKPEAVTVLLKQVEQADGLLLACPEYNYSIAPALKNALDWISRGTRESPSQW
jgi:NAD(P)H-dependent FMN reductase